MIKTNNSNTIYRSLLLSVPIFIFGLFAATQAISKTDMQMNIATGVTIIYLFTMFFLIIHKKKTYKYRSILFISIALAFPLGFILGLYELRGHFMTLTFENMLTNEAKFCAIGVTQNILPLIFNKEILFPIAVKDVAMTLLLVLIFGLMIGRGWCSWGCFWGGWEEGCSRIRKKALIKKTNPKLRLLPFAVLVSTAFLSTAFFTSFYCFWLCPFKTVSEFVEVTTPKVFVQTVIFLLLFFALVVVLPILTRKRIQCTTLCPLGAFMSFFHKINPFTIVMDRQKCIDCKKCVKLCPVLALSKESLNNGTTNISCIRCARCVDNCPEKAISFHIHGTKLYAKPELKRMLFLYPASFVTFFIGAGAIQQFFYRIFIFVSTGSFLH